MTNGIARATYYPSDHAAARPPSFAEVTRREGFRGLNTAFSLESVPLGVTAADLLGPGVLVGSYNWGRDARRLGALSPTERADAVVEVISNFHPEI